MFFTLKSLQDYVNETRDFGRWLKSDALAQLERAHNLVRPRDSFESARLTTGEFNEP